MTMSIVSAFALAILGTAAREPVKVDSAPPAALIGTWDVERVEADRQDQMHWDIHPGDPRLLGRSLEITTDSASFPPEMDRCSQKTWRSITGSWDALFKKGFSRAAMGGRSGHPKPADFGFKPPSGGQASAFLLCAGNSHKDEWMESTWVAPTSADSLMMHRDAQVLLVLKRRPSGAKPTASFSCEKASGATETAICRSFALASWDRSVAAAYKAAVSRKWNQASKIRDEQKAWLKERNACNDQECMENSMRDRVDDLIGQTEYGH